MINTQKKIRLYFRCLVTCLVILLVISPTFTVRAEPAGKKIKIGIIGPKKFATGRHASIAAAIGAEDINAAGGVLIKGVRHDIELVDTDSNEYISIPDAINAMDRLLSRDKVNFVVGGHRSEAVLAQMELIADFKTIFFISAGHPQIMSRVAKDYEKYKYIFRIHTNIILLSGIALPVACEVAVNAVRTKLGFERPKVAMMTEKAIWSETTSNLIKKRLPLMGADFAGEWKFSLREKDLSSELTAIKNSGAHVVYILASGPAGVITSKQIGELKIPVALVGLNGVAQSIEHWRATGGKCNYETTINNLGRVKITEKTIPFYDKFHKKSKGDYPLFSVSTTYDALWMLKEAIERVGTLDNDTVAAELVKLDYTGVQGRNVFFGKGHKMPHDIIIAPGYMTWNLQQWRDGKLVTVWPDGKAVLGDTKWIGVRYPGTVDYQLPPRMMEYWKK
ncbi:MAG: ABC transporter substrate-binding protein [Thermodesulfobacteriota bacterium]|nr:ABC transporter substrate-binding protein [Thermodesulfobacteriota bacterium]